MKTLLLSNGERSDSQYEQLRIFSGSQREFITTGIKLLFTSGLGDERESANKSYLCIHNHRLCDSGDIFGELVQIVD